MTAVGLALVAFVFAFALAALAAVAGEPEELRRDRLRRDRR